jgi:hypothetical protein
MGDVPDTGCAQRYLAPPLTIRTAFWLAFSRLHLCAMNCFWMCAKHRDIILSFDDPKLAFRHL